MKLLIKCVIFIEFHIIIGTGFSVLATKCSGCPVQYSEVASAWECRVGPPDQPASADRIQSLFNDIELYPTKTQVFEMLVCARQCARRKSLTLTFGEFCVFAAELRRCSRQARQTSNKPESPQWNIEKELKDKDAICKHVNGEKF
ncbi:unnamed protein product [Arctia plantaginis]|uniref:Secreted protein n=1 Tax=Arctia plantaginis TaxID=874455 RepID=A0A8S0ZZ94_ARCPL|nr:unnamed protein product [Arctia plantaginis]